MAFYKKLGINLKISTKFIQMTRYKVTYSNAVFIKLNGISQFKWSYPYQHLCKNYCYHSFKGDDSDSDGEDIEYKRDIKNLILPNHDDTLTVKISECKSLQDIFDLIRYNNDLLNWKNVSMAIAMIRELQIIYNRVCMYEKNLNCSNTTSENNFENILTNTDFLNLLNLIKKHYKFMDLQCLSYSILCLHKIGVDMNCIINQTLSHRLKNLLITTPIKEVQSCMLSRYTVTIVSRRNLSDLCSVKHIWPIIIKKMGESLCLV